MHRQATWGDMEKMYPRFEDLEGHTWKTLAELAADYRGSELRLKVGIMEVEDQMKVADGAQMLILNANLRILQAMLRDVRDARVMCTRYYEPGYYRNPRMSLNPSPTEMRIY